MLRALAKTVSATALTTAPAGSLNTLLPIDVADLFFAIEGRPLVRVDRLRIGAGGPTLILGPNGAGKSLLLRLLHGLLNPTRGSVRFQGHRPGRALRQRQAMVFQRPVILRRSVAANVDYALKAQGIARADRAPLVAAHLAEAKLSHKARQPARSLSGGEQQLLALVRALATDPDILFLDEPTSSLDPGITLMIETMIQQAAAAGTKIIMVSHDVGQARRLAAEVLFCHHGEILEQSAAPDFFEKPQSDIARRFVAGELVI